ncbi:hypothetical protein [Streptomyces sp. NPDC003730]
MTATGSGTARAGGCAAWSPARRFLQGTSRDGRALQLDHLAGERSEETVEDGELRLHLDFQDAHHAEWALWQHALYAEVEAPQWLLASLHRRATAIAARYAPSAGGTPPTPGRPD